MNDEYGAHFEYDRVVDKYLRNNLHSIFCIPTLKHLTLKNARTWEAFIQGPFTDNSRVGTSNLMSLSVLSTVPISRDLKEILTWPKALKYLCHESEVGRNDMFHSVEFGYGGPIASPGNFINGLRSQRLTLEELIFGNEEDCCGTDESTFGKNLREFTSLKRLSVPRECFPVMQSQLLHEGLPPSLEEAWIHVDEYALFNDHEKSVLIQELQELAMNKEQYCPKLKTFVLWAGEPEPHTRRSEFKAEGVRVLRELGLVPKFQEAGIRLEVMFGDTSDFDISDLKDYSTNVEVKLVK